MSHLNRRRFPQILRSGLIRNARFFLSLITVTIVTRKREGGREEGAHRKTGTNEQDFIIVYVNLLKLIKNILKF